MAGYGNNNQRFTEPRKRIALDNRKLSLSAPSNAEGRFASMTWALVSNNPRITVYTNDPSDQTEKNQNGRIQAALDAPTLWAIIELLKKIIAAPAPIREFVVNENFIFPAGKKSEKPMPQSEIHLGKDEDGSIWISVFHFNKERPRLKFYFGANFDSYNKVVYHKFYHGNKEPYTRAETSELYARAYIEMLSALYAHLLVTEYVEPKPADDSKGRGNGGGNSRGGQEQRKPEPEGYETKSESGGGGGFGDDDFMNF